MLTVVALAIVALATMVLAFLACAHVVLITIALAHASEFIKSGPEPDTQSAEPPASLFMSPSQTPPPRTLVYPISSADLLLHNNESKGN